MRIFRRNVFNLPIGADLILIRTSGYSYGTNFRNFPQPFGPIEKTVLEHFRKTPVDNFVAICVRRVFRFIVGELPGKKKYPKQLSRRLTESFDAVCRR